MSLSKNTAKAHTEFCNNCFNKRIFSVTVLRQHPHFTDTGVDTEVLSTDNLVSAWSFEEARNIAQDKWTPPNIDPSLVSFHIELLYAQETY